MGHAEAETRVCVRTPSPGIVVGPKAHRIDRGESLEDAPGTREYG
jgi:ribosomal protein S3